jgi:hypothetical protein
MTKCKHLKKSTSKCYLAWLCKNIKSLWHNSFVNDDICQICLEYCEEDL